MGSANRADFVIIGAGIAGASVAYWLAPHGKVVILERESHPGFHSTGRSAALYMASYGNAQVRALTLASKKFFDAPPQGFCAHPLLSPRGALMVAERGQEAALEQHWAVLAQMNTGARRLTGAQACQLSPALRPERIVDALIEPDAADMDVNAIHQGFLRGAVARGGEVRVHSEVVGLDRHDNQWTVTTQKNETWQAPVVIDAAGAWADELAKMAGASRISLQPCRRSALLFKPEGFGDFAKWPMTYGASENWYFKPDAGQVLVSPANADPVSPQDVQPEELDIAIAIDRIESVTTFMIRRPSHTWAGLRSFVQDHGLVGGFDEIKPGFFWIAAQGGYGIQTSPAMGEACAALVRGLPIPPAIADWGLTKEMLSASRLSER
ncbi:MAG: FAD-binding oxidoreductase [Burkholderiales bacterium]|nr:FAD-binding oxidoreductase [Burkholderiales bacterium]